jgi:hypothetical protein
MLATAWSSLQGFAFNDYDDEASRAVALLRDGNFHGFLDAAPVYGPSLLLRAPLAWLPNLWHGGELAAYRTLAIPCLAAAAVLGLALFHRLARDGRPRAAWLALALCACSPVTLRALDVGHAEELLSACLLGGAALAALRNRALLCGLLLGLALVNKAPAVLAVLPLLAVLQHGRARALLTAGAVTVAGWAPFVLGHATATTLVRSSGASTGPIFQPWQLWWFTGSHDGVVRGRFGDIKVGYRTPPEWSSMLGHRFVVLACVALCVAVVLTRWQTRTPLRPVDGLALLAACLLLRCVLDPWNTAYYELPFLMTLLVWEITARRGPPLLSAAATATTTLTMIQTGPLSPDAQAALYLAWALPAAAALTFGLLAPRAARRLGARVSAATGRRLPSLSALTATR